ncbi:hypothetical protein ACI8AF_15870 [Blastococcus sp. SYSU D00669]
MVSSRGTRRLTALLGVPCTAAVAVHGELSAGALIAVAGAGLALAAVGLAQRAGRAAPPVGRRGVPWLVLLVAAVGWELVLLGVDGVPTLSDLLDPVLAHPVVRGPATVGWLVLGSWLLLRPGHEDRP